MRTKIFISTSFLYSISSKDFLQYLRSGDPWKGGGRGRSVCCLSGRPFEEQFPRSLPPPPPAPRLDLIVPNWPNFQPRNLKKGNRTEKMWRLSTLFTKFELNYQKKPRELKELDVFGGMIQKSYNMSRVYILLLLVWPFLSSIGKCNQFNENDLPAHNFENDLILAAEIF